MTKGKKILPMFTTKPEPEFIMEPVETPDAKPIECPNCKARLVEKIAGGDAALALARCQQCGKQYRLDFGKLVPYMEFK